MAKIAVYDRFFETDVFPEQDIVGQALECEALDGISHELLGNKTDIRRAAEQIIHFSTLDEEAQPGVVIIGGMLSGESEYRDAPAAVLDPCTVRRRTLLGGFKDEVGVQRTFLLPKFGEDRVSYEFPSIITVGNVPESIPPELVDEYYGTVSAISGLVLSRVAKTYLPRARRLGISKFLMLDAELTEETVIRDRPDAVGRLREQLQQ